MTQFIIQPNETPVEILTRVLVENNYPNPHNWTRGLSSEATTSPDLKKRVFLINRHWYDILGELRLKDGIDTMDARYCLVDTDNLDNWVQSFIAGVLPCLMKHILLIQKIRP